MRRLRLDFIMCVVLYGLAGCVGGNPLKVSAASPKHFSKGMWDVSTAGSASIHRVENELVDRMTAIKFSPQYGYFITDRLEVLVALGVEYQETVYKKKGNPLELDLVKQENYSLAAGLQYNFDNGSEVIPFLRVYGGAVASQKEIVQRNIPLIGTASEEDETTAPYFGIRIGVRCFIAENISTDIGLGWKRVLYDSDFGDDTGDYSVVIGCAIFF